LADHEVNRALNLVQAREQEIRDAWNKHFGG
jgi:hypothetical protein